MVGEVGLAPVTPSSSNSNNNRLRELQIEIEKFLKDKELLRELDANELTRGGRAYIMLKEDIKGKSQGIRDMIDEIKSIKATMRTGGPSESGFLS
jgi:hypothetical protein